MNDEAIRRQARRLLKQITQTKRPLDQRLLLAAAITKVMERAPIVVGGTAEEYWAGGEYHATDLGLCRTPSERDVAAFRSIGLERKQRHWTAERLPVAVEFPGEGDDIERTVPLTVGGVSVLMISCEDLYLDRLRQSTAAWPREDTSFDGAFEIALTNFAQIDWDYVATRIDGEVRPNVRTAMRAANRRVRSRARRGLAKITIGTS